jgi:hypothetical protein
MIVPEEQPGYTMVGAYAVIRPSCVSRCAWRKHRAEDYLFNFDALARRAGFVAKAGHRACILKYAQKIRRFT